MKSEEVLIPLVSGLGSGRHSKDGYLQIKMS